MLNAPHHSGPFSRSSCTASPHTKSLAHPLVFTIRTTSRALCRPSHSPKDFVKMSTFKLGIIYSYDNSLCTCSVPQVLRANQVDTHPCIRAFYFNTYDAAPDAKQHRDHHHGRVNHCRTSNSKRQNTDNHTTTSGFLLFQIYSKVFQTVLAPVFAQFSVCLPSDAICIHSNVVIWFA